MAHWTTPSLDKQRSMQLMAWNFHPHLVCFPPHGNLHPYGWDGPIPFRSPRALDTPLFLQALAQSPNNILWLLYRHGDLLSPCLGWVPKHCARIALHPPSSSPLSMGLELFPESSLQAPVGARVTRPCSNLRPAFHLKLSICLSIHGKSRC